TTDTPSCYALSLLDALPIFLIDDFHGAATQHVGRTHHQRIADGFGSSDGFFLAARGGVLWLTQVQALNHLLEALAILGAVDGVGDRKSTRLNSSHVKISYAV